MSSNVACDVKFLKNNERKSHKKKEEDDKHLMQNKKKKKDKKSKKSKKERKKLKKKRKHVSSDTESSSRTYSDSDSDSELESVSHEGRETIERKENAQDIMESALLAVSDKTKGKTPGNKNRCITDRPGQSARELNPYWKDGGNGLPKEEGITSKSYNEGKKDPHLNFLKPSDEAFSSSSFPERERRRNWMKKTFVETERDARSSDKSTSNHEAKKGKILTDSELNALAAKVVKAEILGNESLVQKLKSELEESKRRRSEAETQGMVPNEKTETIILTKTNRQGFTVPADITVRTSSRGECSGKKIRKVDTHESGQRLRYFPDDDKYSLKEMFVKEKGTTAEDEERATIKKLAKGSRSRKGSRRDEEEEEIYLDAARYEESEEKKKAESLNAAKVKQKSLEGCKWCLENKNESKHLIVEIRSKCYLCLPEETSLTEGHCLIVPIYHTPCGTATDEDVWEEMQNFRKNLCDMFSEIGKEPIFFENARTLHRFPHMVLHCVPVDKEEGDLAPIYFKKALLESETEWSNNKKVVDLKTRDVRKSIPKGLSYFAVDFGRENGFAHVIEDEKLFPKNFAEEIIGGMLDLDHRIWRKHQQQKFKDQRDKFLKFIQMFRHFSSRSTNTKAKNNSSTGSSSSDSD